MNSNLIIFLALHIIFGTLAIILLTAYLLSISKKDPSLKSLKLNSFVSFLSIIISWISGGYYYTTYYGKSVKPLILKGELSWIHSIIMETKEHIFLFLPFLTLTIFGITYLLKDKLEKDKNFRFATAVLCFTTVSIILAILIGGIVISGAVKK
ncbi:MAG: hypothetical protein Q8P25_03920 [Candidatus Curtissbacteria bacterium]|nr:hypothetical protein [Candidatus Curtissbacteria bacterium]